MVETTLLCTRTVDHAQLVKLLNANKRPIRTISWDVKLDKIPHHFLSVPTERISLDKRHIATYANNTDALLTCIAQSWPMYEKDLIIWVPRPFYSGISKTMYIEILRYIQMPAKVDQITNDYIKKTFGGQPYVLIHLRGFEGKGVAITKKHCSMGNLGLYLPEELSCSKI